jgi:hypothetical protein
MHIKIYRESNGNLPPVPASPAKTSVALLPEYSISKQMRSMELAEFEYELSRSKGTTSSLVATTMTNWWKCLFEGEY